MDGNRDIDKLCDYPSIFVLVIQSYCIRLSVGLLSYDSSSNLLQLDHRKKSERVERPIQFFSALQLYGSRLYVGLPSYNTRSTLIRLDRWKKIWTGHGKECSKNASLHMLGGFLVNDVSFA